MATLPHLHVPRTTFVLNRPRTPARFLPALPRAERNDARRVGLPSRSASVVPVLLSLGGLFALAVGASYAVRAIVGLLAGLLSAT